jgi:hypothetical protein
MPFCGMMHDGVLCYTSQNVGEFWNVCTRPVDRNGYGLSPQETDRLAKTFEEKPRLLPDSLAKHWGSICRAKSDDILFANRD